MATQEARPRSSNPKTPEPNPKQLSTDEIKDWLGRGEYLLLEIEAEESAKQQALERAASHGTPSHQSAVSKTKPGRGDTALVAYADYSARRDARIAELNRTLSDIANAVYSVKDGLLRVILIKRYILFEKWEKIAADLNIDWRHVHRLHIKALKTIILQKRCD